MMWYTLYGGYKIHAGRSRLKKNALFTHTTLTAEYSDGAGNTRKN